MANRLIDSTSPYLLQHAYNPVEWYPWGAEAIERARREGKPIFLSIGYAACHWCHVMERECFERPEIAAVMNRDFVNIKVDREERPDLDDLYMLATQVMSGSGGWPMSVWLTPELKPFYAGTYFPPVDGYGRPGFPRLLTALANTWQNRRGELLEQAEKVVEAVKLHVDESDGNAKRETRNAKLDFPSWVRLAVEQMADRFDAVNGGFGGAPKFPPHQGLGFWLAILERGEGSVFSVAELETIAGKVKRTLDGMMHGGIYDHVGGAFARYSTDERWLVPHFEKMLYDSAQLAPVYARAAAVLGDAEYARVARETLDFFLREMCSEEGAFYSSLDADSEGEEGKYYVWTIADVKAVLDEPAAARVMAYFGMTAEGNWHESPVAGGNVLAVAEGQSFDAGIGAALERMRAVRAKRVRPGLDDKALTSWNGLMLSALAQCGRILKEQRYVAAAARLAEFLLTKHAGAEGRLLRTSRNGAAHTEGFLDDYAFVLNGLMDLAGAADEKDRAKTLKRAESLAAAMIADFEDEARGGFYFTGPRHERLFARMKNAADNATPSANGVAIQALLRLSKAGIERYREIAERAIGAFRTNIARRPEYFATIMWALAEDGAASMGNGAATTPDESDSPPRPPTASAGPLHLSIANLTPDESGAFVRVTLRLEIAAGYHIQPAQAPKGLVSTVAQLRGVEGLEVASQEWEFPAVQQVDGGPGYAGMVEIKGKCRLAGYPGRHLLRASMTAQACTATACLSPETVSAEVEIEIG